MLKGSWKLNGTSRHDRDVCLFVDDEKLIRNSFALELRAKGFKVTTAASGSEGIGEVEMTRYVLVVIDLMMPNVDGFGVR